MITSTYYDLINQASNARMQGSHIVETVIVGMNFGKIAELFQERNWLGMTKYVSGQVDRLEAAGAELIIGTSNTVHEVMGEVMAGRVTEFLPITAPLIDAVEASGHQRIAMFGTTSTMDNGAVMREVMDATDAQIIAPKADERTAINSVIFDELVNYRFLQSSRQRYADIAQRMKNEDGIEGVILGCTEICLLIDQSDLPDLTVFATAKLHTQAAVARAFA